MTTPEPAPRRDTLAEVQRILAHARPDQIERLVADILASDTPHDEAPERWAS